MRTVGGLPRRARRRASGRRLLDQHIPGALQDGRADERRAVEERLALLGQRDDAAGAHAVTASSASRSGAARALAI